MHEAGTWRFNLTLQALWSHPKVTAHTTGTSPGGLENLDSNSQVLLWRQDLEGEREGLGESHLFLSTQESGPLSLRAGLGISFEVGATKGCFLR